MSLLADSSPPPKMPSKRLFEKGGINTHRPSNFKYRKLDVVRSFPAKCGPTAEPAIIWPKPNACVNSPSNNNIKRSKMDFARDFPEQCGEKYALAIPAVPLRSVPPVNVKTDPGNSVPSDGKNDYDGKRTDKDDENKVRSLDESWENDLEKLAAVIAEAKSYLNNFDRLPSSECDVLRKRASTEEPKPSMETVKREEKAEVCVMSREEWSKLRSCITRKCDGGAEKVKSDRKVKGVSDCELTDTKRGEKNQEHNFMDLDEFASLGETEHDESLEKFTTCHSKAVVVYSDINIKAAVKGNNEPKYYDDNEKGLINLSIVKHEEPRGVKVIEALKLFEEYYKEIVKGHKVEPRGERKSTYSHLEAAERLKREGKYIFPEKPFGHTPGVEIGDEFRFRSQLALVGLHRQLIAGIDHVVLGGKKYATSVVESGRYKNTAKTLDVLIYSGQGGNLKIADNSADQKLERGNLALMNTMEMGYPVRVTYKKSHERGVVYVYDGLYTVNNAWQERDQSGKLVFKFELHRMSGQPRSHQTDAKSKKAETRSEACIIDDISQGKEKMPIRVMNGVDDERPPPFTYVTSIIYPSWYQQIEPVGCDCVNGCSDSNQCPCVVKNGGEIPFNETGSITKATNRSVHECGPSCKCPATCMNRVGQHGPRYRLEIFKTEQRGWGVRSRDLIPSGGFICEYVGEFLREKEADLRIGDDEYLFDIFKSRGGRGDGFAIDAAMFGNIGRFINHSCSPNLYAQKVIYDHGDKRMPHIMFFATKDIAPLKELSYDYNYKLGTVCDANGNIKTKDCYCGSRKCSKRMY